MIRKDFIHLEGIKKRQKGPPHQYFCRRFVEISILQRIFSLPFTNTLNFTYISALACFSRWEFAMFIKYERRKTFSSVQ